MSRLISIFLSCTTRWMIGPFTVLVKVGIRSSFRRIFSFLFFFFCCRVLPACWDHVYSLKHGGTFKTLKNCLKGI